jgi:hypothetical protein
VEADGSSGQTSGFFAFDSDGIVRWGRAAERADDIPSFDEAVSALWRSSESADVEQ